MKLWLILGALLALAVLYPTATTAALGALSTAAAWAIAQPTILAFALGALAGPRIARTTRRWAT